MEAVRPSSYGEEDLQLQLALAMSKEEHDEEVKRRKGDELKLQMALEESRKTKDDDVCLLHKFVCLTVFNIFCQLLQVSLIKLVLISVCTSIQQKFFSNSSKTWYVGRA